VSNNIRRGEHRLERIMISISEDAKKRKISNKKIAEKLKISESQVSNYFSLKYRIPFNKFIAMVIMIYEEQKQIDNWVAYFLEKTKKADNIKEAAEWFSVNGDYQRLSNLIKTYKNDECIFPIYELFLKRNRKKINKEEFYRSVEAIREQKTNDPEFKILRRIAQAYSYLDFKSYTSLEFLAKDTLQLINKLKKDFIQTSYKLRCYELIAIAHLARNEIIQAEEILIKSLNETNEDTFPIPVISFLSLLSEVYMFRDYKQSLDYNQKAFRVYNKVPNGKLNDKLNVLKSTHDFIKIHHNDFTNLFLTDPSEQAHLLVKNGGEENVKMALDILNKLENENGLSPFQLYYKGMALEDPNVLEQSEYEFINKGNIFYSSLPRNAKKMITCRN
jgi:predicted transcriptional regulator